MNRVVQEEQSVEKRPEEQGILFRRLVRYENNTNLEL